MLNDSLLRAMNRRTFIRSSTIGTSAIPVAIVLIWASGFATEPIVAPHAEPLGFFRIRVVLTALVQAGIRAVLGAIWPHGGQASLR